MRDRPDSSQLCPPSVALPPHCSHSRGSSCSTSLLLADGCWFWTARGSGVFVNTQSTIHVRSRNDAMRGSFGLRTTVHKSRWSPSTPLPSVDESSPKGMYHTDTDCAFANITRRLGAHSLQVLKGHNNVFQTYTRAPFELIHAGESCMRQTKRIRACPTIPLRTGWKADKRCICEDKLEGTRTEHLVIQCAGGAFSTHSGPNRISRLDRRT